MKYFITLVCVGFLCSCKVSSKTSEDTSYVLWVNSLKKDCVGVGPQKCMETQKGNALNSNNWSFFYQSIDGFAFEEGYIYKLKVREEKLTTDNVPTDGSSLKYTLVEVLEKQHDKKIRLHDIWALQTIAGGNFKEGDFSILPQLEINMTTNQVMGTDGCNNFMGSLKTVTEDSLIFGPLAGTRKACINMKNSDQFNKNLNATATYKREELVLYLYDKQGSELLSFKKVD